MENNINNFNSVTSSIDELHIQDINNSEHSSYFFKTDDYNLLIIRFFKLNNDGLEGVSTPYLITPDAIYRYERGENSFTTLQSHDFLMRSIEAQLTEGEWLVKKYIEEIDTLEDGLYTRKIPSIFLDVWFDLKKDLTRVDRILERSYEVLEEYIAAYSQTEDFPKESMRNILEHIERYQRLANLNTAKLDTLYNYYNSLKNDKINNNIYTLTVLSGVFLPLNLVVGFFGMNTENLFFQGNPEGTLNVFTILIAMFIALLILFPIVRLLERYILQKILGRFSLYNKLVDNIKKITHLNE